MKAAEVQDDDANSPHPHEHSSAADDTDMPERLRYKQQGLSFQSPVNESTPGATQIPIVQAVYAGEVPADEAIVPNESAGTIGKTIREKKLLFANRFTDCSG